MDISETESTPVCAIGKWSWHGVVRLWVWHLAGRVRWKLHPSSANFGAKRYRVEQVTAVEEGWVDLDFELSKQIKVAIGISV